MNTNFSELLVDGKIVDLNRIPLPTDTPIIDERFKVAEKKRPVQSGAASSLLTFSTGCSHTE